MLVEPAVEGGAGKPQFFSLFGKVSLVVLHSLLTEFESVRPFSAHHSFELPLNRTVNCIKTGRLAEAGNQDLKSDC
jgi:hypothetical protein